MIRFFHFLAALLLSGALGVPARADPVDLPRIGEPADVALSPLEEARIGSRITSQLYTHEFILEDPELTEYVSGLTWRLIAAADAQPPHMTVFVLRDPRINAFALPGGYIGVNAGLLTSARNESELAGVLAHELAHVTQRHIARTLEGTQAANMATWAAVLGAILAASANPEVVIAALSVGQAANYQREVNFTRAHELEADRIGIRTLAQARFDPEAMASFFVRLEQQSRLYGNQLPEFLRTHPVNTTRISEARTRAAGLAPRKVHDPVEFGLMQARARVLSAGRASEAAEYFSAQLGADDNSAANRYGLALAYSRLGRYGQASTTLQPTLEAYPRQVNLALLEARLQMQQSKTDAALARLKRTLQHHPRYTPAVLEYADSLIAANAADEARQLLLEHEQIHGIRPDTYRLLAFAARDTGQTIEAQFQMANYLHARGDFGGALSQLDAALRLAPNDHERARLKARRAEIASQATDLPRPAPEQQP